MLPATPLFQKMRRIVRDISSEQGKNIELVTHGEHIEMDKAILERIVDPLIHLIRNAADHGIESQADRIAAGKDPHAKITLKAEHKEETVVITISDDGKGINPETIVQKAIQKGLISKDTPLSEQEALALIFRAGFSTKEQVTEISGRGMGMDIVEKAIHNLKGSIEIENRIGKGVLFRIILPLSLSVIHGLIIKSGNRHYVIPLAQLLETVEFRKYRVEKTRGKGKVMTVRGEVIPILSLNKLLPEMVSQSRFDQDSETDHGAGVIVLHRGQKVSFEVDELLNQQQIVIKKLGVEINGLPGIVGGTILKDGSPSLILNLSNLLDQTGRTIDQTG
jgi:two-component system, chemotaxis family, sensor kinase CheA